jgi:hypothetical protein
MHRFGDFPFRFRPFLRFGIGLGVVTLPLALAEGKELFGVVPNDSEFLAEHCV